MQSTVACLFVYFHQYAYVHQELLCALSIALPLIWPFNLSQLVFCIVLSLGLVLDKCNRAPDVMVGEQDYVARIYLSLCLRVCVFVQFAVSICLTVLCTTGCHTFIRFCILQAMWRSSCFTCFIWTCVAFVTYFTLVFVWNSDKSH